jgi:TrmH family RNA methyltransferase
MKRPSVQAISASSNPRLKRVRKLKVGFGCEQILVEGWKLIHEALRAGLQPLELWVTDASDAKLDCQSYVIPNQLYGSLSPTKQGKPPLGVFAAPDLPQLPQQPITRPSLLLDRVQDPGNAGALVRAAAAFEFEQVIWHKPSIYPYHHGSIRSSAGTLFHMQHWILDSQQMSELSGQLIGADLAGTPLPSFKWPTAPVLVMGNEGHGLSPEIERQLQATITIPISARAESLNVAGAAHVLMYDFALKQG